MLKTALLAALVLAALPLPADEIRLHVPRLEEAPTIDGDLSEWKDRAHHDGLWDMQRISQAPWYALDRGARNRLTDHGDEPRLEEDLNARYYIAWDERYLYLGAEVRDNVNDVADPAHEPKRWYFKDCICWFIEAPRDRAPEFFGQGDNAFCFVADAARPPHAAWWRHGAPGGATYVEEPLPPAAVDYELRFDPWGTGAADFALEARVDMAATFAKADPRWQPPRAGDEYGLEIVHTDPDGGAYGGHFMIYGNGDDDSTWGLMILTGPQKPIERRPE